MIKITDKNVTEIKINDHEEGDMNMTKDKINKKEN